MRDPWAPTSPPAPATDLQALTAEAFVYGSYDDGSLTLVLQRDDPGDAERDNWLPTPPGLFRPILRMYAPRPEALDGSFELPPIVRRG